MATVLDFVISYLRRSWLPVPIPHKQKGPVLKGWEQLRLTELTAPRYFNGGPQNVGVILGQVSNDLVDIDLDSLEAIALAPQLLPPTIRFGRSSARAAHWLYHSAFPGADKATIMFRDPQRSGDSAMLVELRIGAGGKAAQTVFPGSTHPSGEAITWDGNGDTPPTDVAGETLTKLVARLAAAALLVRYWPPKGRQHDLSLALGGALARAGWDAPTIEQFVTPIVQAAQDPRPADRIRCACEQVARLAAGKHVFGLPKLRELLGHKVTGALSEWLGLGQPSVVAGRIRLITDLTAMADAAEQAIVAAGLPVYRTGTLLLRPVVQEARGLDDLPVQTVGLSRVEVIMMRSFMEQAMPFERHDRRAKEWVPCKPPADVAELILARAGHWPFPPIRGVLAAPSLRPDGSLLTQAGYDAATAMYLIDPPPMPDIPEHLSHAQGQQAADLLAELLTGFPFVDDDARAVGLSALISPVVRAALSTVPLHAVSAPEAGTGKSYLTQLAAVLATGFPCPVIATGADDEELEKRLGTALLSGYVMASIDNVSRPLGGDFLCQVLDQPVVSVRMLGLSKAVRLEPRLTLFATGNNLILVGDVVRRSVIARIDAACDDPYMRQFRDDPIARVLADRGKYIAAALTVCKAWQDFEEKPLPPVASFAGWSNLVRSAIHAFGYGDAAKTIASASDDDPDRQTFAAVLAAWFAALSRQHITAAELITLASKRDPVIGSYNEKDLRDALMAVAGGKDGNINPYRFGVWLRSHRDRMINGRTLRRQGAGHAGAVNWSVQ